MFLPNRVRVGNEEMPFAELVKRGLSRPRLALRRPASTRRPRSTGTATRRAGRPFYYFAYGAAVSEVSIDTLTGEYTVDARRHPARRRPLAEPGDRLGQIEGGFIQGMGWLTTEELWWDDKGRLRTHAPSTYKIPLPPTGRTIFNMKLWPKGGEPRADDLPLQGGRRAAAHAGDLGVLGAVDAVAAARRLPRLARSSTRRRRRSASCSRSRMCGASGASVASRLAKRAGP